MKSLEAIPASAVVQKVGRKIETGASSAQVKRRQSGIEWYRRNKMKKVVLVIQPSNSSHLDRSLRPRTRALTGDISAFGEMKILECCDILSSQMSDLSLAQEAMKSVIESMETNFEWKMTMEGGRQLFLIKRNNNDMSFHPWVEVKKSNVDSDESGEFTYGLYAYRRFKRNDCIGMFIGRLLKGVDESGIESIFKVSVGNGMIHLDIDDKGPGRLSYGFGSHMMNDTTWGKEVTDGKENNTLFNKDLSVIATKDIEIGEEITVGYNF